MLQLIENEIAYCAVPVKELLDEICSRTELSGLKFAADCKKAYEENSDFSLSWKKSLGEMKTLSHDDVKLLYSFGEALGTTDVSGQVSICKLHAKLFEERLRQAKEDIRLHARMYTNLGALAGVFAAVMLS